MLSWGNLARCSGSEKEVGLAGPSGARTVQFEIWPGHFAGERQLGLVFALILSMRVVT